MGVQTWWKGVKSEKRGEKGVKQGGKKSEKKK